MSNLNEFFFFASSLRFFVIPCGFATRGRLSADPSLSEATKSGLETPDRYCFVGFLDRRPGSSWWLPGQRDLFKALYLTFLQIRTFKIVL